MKTKVTFTIVLLISTIFIGCPNPTGPDISSTVAVTGVTLDKSSITLLTSATEQLTATVEPGNADNKNVSWASDDEAVAEVDSSGLVTGVGVGTTIVRVTTEDGGKIDGCSVTVTDTPAAVTGVTLDKSSITLLTSATEQLTATVEPGNADNKNVSWASDDEAVAEVDSSGLVTGVGVGTTIVRVTTEDGGKIDECSVTVLGKVLAQLSGATAYYGDDPAWTFQVMVWENGDPIRYDTNAGTLSLPIEVDGSASGPVQVSSQTKGFPSGSTLQVIGFLAQYEQHTSGFSYIANGIGSTIQNIVVDGDMSLTFNIADFSAANFDTIFVPHITSTVPIHDTTNISTDLQEMVISFDQMMWETWSFSWLRTNGSDTYFSHDAEDFSSTWNTETGTDALTISIGEPLLSSTQFKLILNPTSHSPNFLSDAFAVPLPPDTEVWFTTEANTTPPIITSVIPANGSTAVDRSIDSIVFTFDQAVWARNSADIPLSVLEDGTHLLDVSSLVGNPAFEWISSDQLRINIIPGSMNANTVYTLILNDSELMDGSIASFPPIQNGTGTTLAEYTYTVTTGN